MVLQSPEYDTTMILYRSYAQTTTAAPFCAEDGATLMPRARGAMAALGLLKSLETLKPPNPKTQKKLRA